MAKLEIGSRVVMVNHKGDDRAIDYGEDKLEIGMTGTITGKDTDDFEWVAKIDQDNGREYGFYRGELKLI
jgi:hypothetical protein